MNIQNVSTAKVTLVLKTFIKHPDGQIEVDKKVQPAELVVDNQKQTQQLIYYDQIQVETAAQTASPRKMASPSVHDQAIKVIWYSNPKTKLGVCRANNSLNFDFTEIAQMAEVSYLTPYGQMDFHYQTLKREVDFAGGYIEVNYLLYREGLAAEPTEFSFCLNFSSGS